MPSRLQGELPLTSSVLTAEELRPLELLRQARQAQKKRGEEIAASRQQREALERARRRELEEKALRARLEQLPRGPNLAPHVRHTAQLDVQQEDLEDLIPDGWGSRWPEECRRLARRWGVPPAAVPLQMILNWCHGLRPAARKSARMTAGALCAVPAWLARKVGCSERWIQDVTNQLDPWAEHRRAKVWTSIRNAIRKSHDKPELPLPPRPGGGTAYLQRHPRVKLYRALQREVPAAAQLPKWMDENGKLHDWVELRGRYYATVMGLRAIRRRAHRHHEARPGRTPKLQRWEMQEDLYRRLAPLYERLRARLNTPPGRVNASRLQREFTPINVHPSYIHVYGRWLVRDPVENFFLAGPDPPRGGGAPPARRPRARPERPKQERSSAAGGVGGPA